MQPVNCTAYLFELIKIFLKNCIYNIYWKLPDIKNYKKKLTNKLKNWKIVLKLYALHEFIIIIVLKNVKKGLVSIFQVFSNSMKFDNYILLYFSYHFNYNTFPHTTNLLCRYLFRGRGSTVYYINKNDPTVVIFFFY